jgi:hypothetical protein
MATITTILASDIIASSRVTLNTNFANLNTDKVDINSTYADPAWITSLAGSKITGSIGGNAATATALATARTIAGVSFDGTANIAIPSSGLSDSADIVRGASSVVSGQVLYGTAAGVAGSEANLFWDAANDRLGVGTNTPSSKVSAVVDATTESGFRVNYTGRTSNLNIQADGADNLYARVSGGRLYLGTVTAGNDFFLLAGSVTSRAVLNGSTGNLLIGTTTDDGTNRLQVAGSGTFHNLTINNATNDVLFNVGDPVGDSTNSQNGFKVQPFTDGNVYLDLKTFSSGRSVFRTGGGAESGAARNWLTLFSATGNAVFTSGTATDNNFRLDIASSGSSGTLRAYDQTPTTGVTQVIVRAGAGQSSTNLQTWQDSSGSTAIFASISSGASSFFVRGANATRSAYFGDSGVVAGSAGRFTWSSNTPDNAADLSLSRAGVNIGQLGDGGSNSNGLLYLKGVRPVGSTVANLPAAAGNTGMMATVTDANATTIGTTVAGGGANTVLVWSNGTNWRIYAN